MTFTFGGVPAVAAAEVADAAAVVLLVVVASLLALCLSDCGCIPSGAN